MKYLETLQHTARPTRPHGRARIITGTKISRFQIEILNSDFPDCSARHIRYPMPINPPAGMAQAETLSSGAAANHLDAMNSRTSAALFTPMITAKYSETIMRIRV